MLQFKKIIAQALSEAVDSIAPGGGLDAGELAVMLEYPPDKAMGDLSFPCFRLSRTLRKAPPVIAGMLCETVGVIPFINKTEAAGGYLNFFIEDSYFTGVVTGEILAGGDNYGRGHSGDGKTLVIDYSSPNVAKPFHIGHLGTTVIGHSLKMLHEFSGWRGIGINHLGDWGTQFGKLIVAYRKWGSPEAVERDGIDELVALYVRFHKEAEEDPTLDDLARTEFTKLEHKDEENTKLWRWFISISIEEYKKTYEKLGIEFDFYTGESFYFDLMPAQVNILKEKNLLKIDDGASLVDLSEYGMPPCLILKRDGSTLYPTRDIAAAAYRKDTYHFDKCIIVTSSQQTLYFSQLFKVMELMGYEWHNELLHVSYGTVSINGEKLATRTGNVILLNDLFRLAVEKVRGIMEVKNPNLENKDEVAEAVGIGAVVFYYLSNSRVKDINFSLEEALSFEGNTGPYAQYTYARCCSVIEKAGGVPESGADAGYSPCESEINLSKTLSRFPEKVTDAVRDSEPMVITRFILDVCADFNRFYHDCQIATAEQESARVFRVRLTACAKTVLGNAFGLICLKKTPKI